MPSLEPTPQPASRKRAPEPDPIAEKIRARLAELRDAGVNPEDAVEQGLLAILETTEIAAGAICLFDARQQILRLAAERGLSDQGCKSLRHIRRGFSGAWDMPLQSLSNRRVYLIENAAQNRYVPPLIDEPDKMRTVLCLPLLTGNTPVGSLIIVSTARKPFADPDVARLEAPGRELAMIIETARARARQSERATAAAPLPDQPYRGSSRTSAESLIGQRFDPDQEIIRARELASDWERKHQELAGELAAATAREQRLRDELTAAAERLQDFSHTSRGKGTKDEAAQLAQNARLQASLAEAETIAARERMRAADAECKLTEMAELLTESTTREAAFRELAEAGGDADAGQRKEFVDQSLEIARLNARLTEAEAALAQTATNEGTLEQARADFESRLAAQRAAADTERGRLEARLADVDTTIAEARQAAQALEAELGVVRAREQALQEELSAATAQHQRLQSEADERERQREQARSGETAQLQTALQDATETAQRATERLTTLEARTQDLAGQLAATSTREQALREELESSARAHEARVVELESLLEHERSLVQDWQRKHEEIVADHRTALERERERLMQALREEATAAAAESVAAEGARTGVEVQALRDRLADLEAGAEREATRAAEWEQRCVALTAQLDEVITRKAAIDRELQEARGQIAARSANAAAAAAEREVETEAMTARLATAEAARAAAEQAVTNWTQRHDALAAELEAAVGRAEEMARALEAVRADNATDRVEAEGARAAARIDADTTRTALADAQQRVETLSREVETLRTAVATLEGEAEQRSADLAAALAAQTERAIEALAPPPPLDPTPVAPATPPTPSVVTQVRPVTTVAATAVKTDVRRIVVLDDPAAWKDVRLHGIETVVLAPGDDPVACLGESGADRVLVNLAARGAFDVALAVRAAGISVPFCGCLVPPGLARGLALGFVEVAHTPLDPDEVTTMLTPYAGRGTRVLTAGADADAFISLRQALGRQGMSVSMAWDGKQASDLLQMVRPEVVVLDLDIPPRSGVGLIVELSAAQSVPMLVLLPGRQDVGKRTAAELADAALASRLLPPDRLLDEVRRSGKPKG